MGRHWDGIVGQGTLAPFITPFPEASLHRGTHNRGVIYDFTDGKMMAKIRSRFRTTSKLIEREMFSTALAQQPALYSNAEPAGKCTSVFAVSGEAVMEDSTHTKKHHSNGSFSPIRSQPVRS